VSPERTSELLEEEMNPALLAGFRTERLIVEADYVDGCRPKPKALRALRKAVERYTPLGEQTEIIVDDVIPRSEWEAAGPDGTARLVQDHLDHVPGREPGTAVLYLLYAPKNGSLFGRARYWAYEQDGEFVRVRGIVMYSDLFRERSVLWITPAKAERSTLVHEFGHVLGLVSNPAHMHRGNGPHCRNPECVMTHPRPRTIAYNFFPALFAGRIPRDYCRDCRKDIARAQEIWRTGLAEDPEYAGRLARIGEGKSVLAEARYAWGAGKQEAAVRMIRNRLKEDPENLELRMTLGGMYRLQGRMEEAEREFRLAAETGPDGPALPRYVRFLWQRGKNEEAYQTIRQAGRIDEPNMEFYVDRSLRGAGRLEEAIEFWRGKLGSRTRERSAGLQLLGLYQDTGRLEEAKALVDGTTGRIRRDPAWRLEEGRLALAEGNRPEARTRFAEGVKEAEKRLLRRKLEDSAKRFYLLTLIRLQVESGNRGRALEVVEGFRRFPVVEPYYSLARAEVFASFGSPDRALTALLIASNAFTLPVDVCLDNYLSPLRDRPEFRKMFPQCAGRPAGNRL